MTTEGPGFSGDRNTRPPWRDAQDLRGASRTRKILRAAD